MENFNFSMEFFLKNSNQKCCQKSAKSENDFRWRRISETDCALGLRPQYVQCSIKVNTWITVVTLLGKPGKVKEFEN